MEEVHDSSGTEPQYVAGGPPPIDVADEAWLINALSHARAGDTILLQAQVYKVGTPLFVPAGVTLQGASGMSLDAQGLPIGFRGTTPTTIKAIPEFKGNLLTLGKNSLVRRIVLEGAKQAAVDRGNVVAVASEGPNDLVSAAIDECVLINNNESGGGTDGPTGGAILAYTRNPQQGAPPPPHVEAVVTLALTKSIVRSHKEGKAVFAMNFASRGKVTINLTKNVIGGPLDIIGGMSRPDAVSNATTTINSHGNHYSPQQPSNGAAWQIVGGSSSLVSGNANADSNSASVQSKDDQIENFQVGIAAVGGRRLTNTGGTCSGNKVNLTLTGMKLATNGAPQADFEFVGARSSGEFPAGDNNAVVVDVLAGTNSDPLFHIYLHDADFGTPNQLVFKGGTLAAFTHESAVNRSRDEDQQL
jgi:hypothetical protein